MIAVRLGTAAAALVAAIDVALAVVFCMVADDGAVVAGLMLLAFGVTAAAGVRLMLRGRARGADLAVVGCFPLFVGPIVWLHAAFHDGTPVPDAILAVGVAAVLVGTVRLIRAAGRQLPP